MKRSRYPRIIWVAAKPPVPPLFAGGAIRSQSAISMLSGITDVRVLTFAPRSAASDLIARSREFWSEVPVALHVIKTGERAAPLEALRRGRFQTSLSIEKSELRHRLEELNWNTRENLVVFDDIVFAPMLPHYGRNAIFSPNDCVSEMFRSHARLSDSLQGALKSWVRHRVARGYEKDFYHHALLTHLVTERDRIWLQDVNPRARYHVAPYADPGLVAATLPEASSTWDVVVWVDLAIASSLRGAQAFLAAVTADPEWRRIRVGVVGRISAVDAERRLGHSIFSRIEYSSFLEGENGQIRHARVTVVPDIGGSGIKSRCLGLLASRKCVACLYSQMEGIQGICDVGAVNAVSPPALADRVKAVLRAGMDGEVAAAGHEFYTREFSREALQHKWTVLVERALTIRDDLRSAVPGAVRPTQRQIATRRDREVPLSAARYEVEPVHARGET